MSQQAAWENFTSRTAIHGFSEYGGLTSKIARVLWIALCLGMLGFCGWQLYDLGKEFVEGKPVTSISISSRIPVPHIGFRFHEQSKEIVGIAPQNKVAQIAAEYASNGGFECMIFGSGLENNETKLFHGDAEESSFTKAYVEKEPKVDFLQETFLFLNKGSGKLTNDAITLDEALSTFGAVHRFTAKNITADMFDEMEFTIRMTDGRSISPELYIMVGPDASEVLPEDPGFMLKLDKVGYRLTLQLVQLSYSERYCNANSKGNCALNCKIREALEDREKCVPYLPGVEAAKGTRICASEKDAGICSDLAAQCAEECRQCKNCRHCEYTALASWGVAEKDPTLYDYSGDVGSNSISVFMKITGARQTQRIHTSEMYSPVAFASQLGGILGLCFGVSLISIFHAIGSVGALAKATAEKKKITSQA